MEERSITQTIGNNLQYYLNLFGITNAELAKRLHVTPTSVGYWVNGQKAPRMDKIEQMTRIFNCTRSDLMDKHTPEDRAFDMQERLINEYIHDPKIRELILFAGGVEPGETRDKYVDALIMSLRAMYNAGKAAQ